MSIHVVNARLDIQKIFKNLAISLGTGIGAALLTGNAMTIYNQLQKPSFAPPGVIFPIVWTILYISMGIAAYIAEINCNRGKLSVDCKSILKIYYFHLFVNFMWPVFFFAIVSPVMALVDAILLCILVIVTTIGFARISKSTLIFMIPYLAWCIYALLINIALL